MNVTLGSEEWFLAEDNNQYRCSYCYAEVPYWGTCPSCPDAPAAMGVEPESHGFITDVNTVATTTWFHITHSPLWYERVLENDVHIHLGTYKAAMVRHAHLYDVQSDMYLYEVELIKPILDPRIYRDVPWDKPHPLPSPRFDGYRYLNMSESIGSVSLFIHPDAFDVVSVERVHSR